MVDLCSHLSEIGLNASSGKLITCSNRYTHPLLSVVSVRGVLCFLTAIRRPARTCGLSCRLCEAVFCLHEPFLNLLNGRLYVPIEAVRSRGLLWSDIAKSFVRWPFRRSPNVSNINLIRAMIFCESGAWITSDNRQFGNRTRERFSNSNCLPHRKPVFPAENVLHQID